MFAQPRDDACKHGLYHKFGICGVGIDSGVMFDYIGYCITERSANLIPAAERMDDCVRLEFQRYVTVFFFAFEKTVTQSGGNQPELSRLKLHGLLGGQTRNDTRYTEFDLIKFMTVHSVRRSVSVPEVQQLRKISTALIHISPYSRYFCAL
jgi:hypothetical protein